MGLGLLASLRGDYAEARQLLEQAQRAAEQTGHQGNALVAAYFLAGIHLALELDAEPRDKYGRLLSYVYVDGERYDDELLREGYARLLVIPPNTEHARTLLRAELRARAERRGLWAACATR